MEENLQRGECSGCYRGVTNQRDDQEDIPSWGGWGCVCVKVSPMESFISIGTVVENLKS